MKDSNLKTGEMGTLVKVISENNDIIKRSKINEAFNYVNEKGGKYNTYFDMNLIVDKEEAHLLEYTTRFGYPISDIIAGASGNVSNLWYGLSTGKINLPKGWMVGVVVNTPPAPYEFAEKEMTKVGDIAIFDDGFTKNLTGINTGIYKDGDIYKTSIFGYTYLVVGVDNDIATANKIANENAKNLNIPLDFFREDIGVCDIANVKHLVEQGYLNGEEVEGND